MAGHDTIVQHLTLPQAMQWLRNTGEILALSPIGSGSFNACKHNTKGAGLVWCTCPRIEQGI